MQHLLCSQRPPVLPSLTPFVYCLDSVSTFLYPTLVCVFFFAAVVSVCLSKAGHTVSFTAVWMLLTYSYTSAEGSTALSHCSLPSLPGLMSPTAPCRPLQIFLYPITCSPHLQLLFTHNIFTTALIPQEHSSFLSFLRPMLPSLACQCLWHHILNPAQSFLFPLSFLRHVY